MPVLGRKPAVFLKDGNVGVVVSEHLRRDRGEMLLKSNNQVYPSIVVEETPLRNERVLMSIITQEGEFTSEAPFFPVLVLERDAKRGALPYRARYVRHALNPEMFFDEKTQQFHLFWTWNSFTPLDRFATPEICRRISLSPIGTVSSGSHQTHPNANYPPHIALQENPATVNAFQVPGDVDNNLYADGVWGRGGDLTLRMGRAEGLPEGMRWLGASINLVCARRPLTTTFTGQGSPTGDILPDLVTLPVEYRPPYTTFSVEKDSFYTLKVAAHVTVGSERHQITWADGNTELTLPPDDEATQQVPFRYTGKVRFQTPLDDPETPVLLTLRSFVDPLAWPQDESAAIYYHAVEIILECFSTEETLTQQYYGGPRDLPVPFTLPLPEGEPHATARTQEDPQYVGAVGDPPDETSSGYAGVYNRHNINEQLLVGGTSQAKMYNPLQTSDGHKKLPETPGMIIPERLRSRAKDINLRSIQDNLEDHAGHLYHQREIQDLRFATRTLMHAVGNLVRLTVQEKLPPGGQTEASDPATTVRIGASTLRACMVDEQYVGERFISVNNTTIIFPFGVSIPSGPGAIAVTLGEQGHQFEASGGRAPYTWTIRRTRSSSLDPARSIDVDRESGAVLFPEDYPFDAVGNPVPEVEDWPVTVVGGGLPPGMAFNNRGLLYGTPGQAGTYLFRLVCKDRDNRVAEQTIRFYVAGGPGDTDATIFFGEDASAADPANYTRENADLQAKTEIVRASFPEVPDLDAVADWVGSLQALGGELPYKWRWVNPQNNPKQNIASTFSGDLIRLSGDGRPQLNIPSQGTFDQGVGLWIWEVEALENYPDDPTLDRAPVTLAVGVQLISDFGGPTETAVADTVVTQLPEGEYSAEPKTVDVLLLDHPTPIEHFQDAQNVMLRGTRGHFTRGDLGGSFIGPGPITTINPGVMTPVGVVGVFELGYNVAKTQIDYSIGNPTGIWTQIDKFDPQQLEDEGQVPPEIPAEAEEGEIVVEDSSILDQTVISKRIRPLWPG